MARPLRILFLFTFLLTAIANLYAQQPEPVEMASLRANQQLHWQRTSPTPQQPDGPVLYQLLFSTAGTPNTIAKFDTNPRHLTNSDIKDVGGMVSIGSSGFTISVNTGLVTFVNGQTFPGTGTVTSVSAASPLSVNNGTTTPSISLNGIVGIANGGTGIATGPTTAGQYLRSTGAGAINWGDIVAGDLPSLSGSYVDLSSDQVVGGNKIFSNLITGNISGNAATATAATTAITASNALALGGNLANLYSTSAQNDARYLQLNGGTLTGGLNGTTASFSGTGSFGGDLSVGSSGGNLILKNAMAVPIQNNNTGTTLNELAELNGSGGAATVNTASTSNTVGTIGIVIAGAGTVGTSAHATVAITGAVTCSFDGPATAGDYIVKSTTTGGMCSDGGANYPTAAQTVGRVITSTGACAPPNCTTLVALYPGEQRAAAGSGTGVTSVSAVFPLSVTNPTTTPNITLSGTVGVGNGGTGLIA